MANLLFGIAILHSVNFVLLLCDAKITSPPDGTRMTFLPGSTAKLKWTVDNSSFLGITQYSWHFSRDENSNKTERLASVLLGKINISQSSLTGVAVEKPATLILKNIDLSYNGTYYFLIVSHSVLTGYKVRVSRIVVYIAVKPTVTLGCSSPISVNEGDDVVCECTGQGGNPPADVTWFKDNIKIGKTGQEEQVLALSNVDGKNDGTYTCAAQSHVDSTDRKSVEVKVKLNFKPKATSISLTPEPTLHNGPAFLMCESDGFPKPSFTIIHNDSTVVSNDKTYVISKVSWNDSGHYKCVANNKLGSDSNSYYMTVVGYSEPEVSAVNYEKLNAEFKPNETSIVLTPNPAIYGGPVILLCESNGFPQPRFTIWHNGSDVVSNDKTYVISKVNWSDSGSYRCIAENKLGRDSKSYFLTVVDYTVPQVGTKHYEKLNASLNSETIAAPENVANDGSGRIVIWHIVVSLMSGIIIGIPFSYIVWRFHRLWFKNRKPEEKHTGQQKEVDAVYQELDLPTFKTGNSCHSTGIASSMYETVNYSDSTYTELSKIRDPENAYQSLF